MRAVVVVDGLNLHHALKNLGPGHSRPDIVKLSARLLDRNTAQVAHFYFSSPPQHLGRGAMDEYLIFKKQLVNTGVQIVEGRFQSLSTTCRFCGVSHPIHKEKETDVAIAVQVCESALDSEVRQMLIFSADSDLVPAIKFAHRLNPELQITVAQTGGFLKFAAHSLARSADRTVKLSSEFLHMYQFDT
jgi:uncharacterized LabA/DUF88 family protein